MKLLIFIFVLVNTFAYSQKSISERLSQKEVKAKNITYSIDASHATPDRPGSMIFVNNIKNEWAFKPTNYYYKGSFRNCISTNDDDIKWSKEVKKAIKSAFTKNRLEDLHNERIFVTIAFSSQGKPLGVRFYIGTPEPTKLSFEELEDIETAIMKDIKFTFRCQEKIANYNYIPLTWLLNFKDLL